MAWLYHNTKDAVNEFSKKYNCDLALAEEYLKVVRGIRNQQPFYVTDEDGEETGEDVALGDSWNYTDILWNGIQAEKVQRAFEKLNYPFSLLNYQFIQYCPSVKEQPLEFGKKTIDTKLGARANMFCSPFFKMGQDARHTVLLF